MRLDVKATHRTQLACLLAIVLMLCALAISGCDPQKADAAQKRRYEVESIGWTSHPYMNVVTDTETGQRWLVVAESTGGVEIEPMDGGE